MNALQKIIINIIKGYQFILSPDRGILRTKGYQTCQFYPTCSEYAIQAIHKYGTLKGIYKSILRVVRCHPWQKNHTDPLL